MFKWIKKLFRKKHKVVDFSQLEPNQQIPTPSGRSVDGLGLTNPDSVLSGQNRGTQSIGGSANIQSDPSGQRLVVNDGTTNRVSFGRIGTGVSDWGLKVSKSGFAVDNATADQLIFNSSQDVFKIVGTGTIQSPALSIAAPGATYSFKDTITNFAHGLSYIPVVIGYINSGGQYYQLPYYFPRGTGTAAGIAWPFLQISADATNVSLTFSVTVFNQLWASNAGDFPVKYYLLQETAN